jgi:diguanylate cyclase (GGDEF)-like protein
LSAEPGSWLAAIPDQKLHFELVEALYSTPKSIFAATLVAMAVVAIAFLESNDRVYMWIAVAFLILGIFRSGIILLYRRSKHNMDDRVITARWERRALSGAWAFALIVGFAGAYTVVTHSGGTLELLINTSVMGYIAGISSRNGSRPLISIGQVSLTACPFALALFMRGDLTHLVLGLFICLLYLSIVMICRSVFENIIARHEAFHKVERLAKRDVLTGLWNRAAFIELLQDRLRTHFESPLTALILIDLDHFKDVNDTHGHQVGDLMLKEVSFRIKDAVNVGDEIGRIGGDEFVAMIIRDDEDEIYRAAGRVLATFAAPFALGTTQYFFGASVGYAVAPIDGSSVEELFRNADLALYDAKRQGRGRMQRHSASITARYDHRVTLEHDLQFALKNHELELLYQPIVDPRSGRAICCEALVRWHHPVLGVVNPEEFIPIAESTGLITSIGAWVLTSACQEATQWPLDVGVAVNLSPVQFRRGTDLVETVIETLANTGLPARRLDLEVTESILIEDSTAALVALQKLRGLGVGVSLDDFGTGFASLSYLNDFPFSKVKIDRKFAKGIVSSSRTAAIIGGIAKTTRELHIELVAEGVETQAQMDNMLRFRIHAMQGFLFCPPLPGDRLRQMLKTPIFTSSPDDREEISRLAVVRAH